MDDSTRPKPPAYRPSYATKSGKLSADEIAQLEKHAARGLSPSQIAFRMSRHPGTINDALTTRGLRALKAKTFAYCRKGVQVRSFSPDEDALAEALRCQDYSFTTIAAILAKRFGHRRSPATVATRLRQLASLAEARMTKDGSTTP